MVNKFITSESVTEGHPDKICDQISDAILDAYLECDENARVAIECMISNNLLVIAGEVDSIEQVDVEFIARKTICSIGYDAIEKGFDGNTCVVIKNIIKQSKDIATGVNCALEYRRKGAKPNKEQIGAGDQGTMYGYACSDSEDLMPLSINLANKLAERLSFVRKNNCMGYLYPDGKTQVTVEYSNDDIPLRITDIIISAQHKDEIAQQKIRDDIIKHVITYIIPTALWNDNIRILVNPSGRFVIGGPSSDTGLTGRKIIVDTYGGVIPHGGGAFSGKDATKLDRSAAYMARYVSKNIVASGLAKRCQIALSYAIGVEKPIAVNLETFNSETIPVEILQVIIRELFDFTPKGIIKQLDLKKALFSETSVYGHFKNNKYLEWEKTNQVNSLKKIVEKLRTRISSNI